MGAGEGVRVGQRGAGEQNESRSSLLDLFWSQAKSLEKR